MRALDAPLVLVASDDTRAAAPLAAALRAEGLQVIACRRAADAVEAVSFHRPTVVVVDVALDSGHGWDVVAAARTHGRLPTIVVDRENDSASRRAAYAAGADDVVLAPFDPVELAIRTNALARRARLEVREGPMLRHRELVMDVAAHEVRLAGTPVSLTAQQFAILRTLLQSGGAALDRAHLIARTESFDDEAPSDRAIDLHVSRLRKRLGDDPRTPRYIEAVYGVGYRLAIGGEAATGRLGDNAVAALDALPDPVLVVDRGLAVRFANRSAERLLGASRASFLGRRCGQVLECRSCSGAGLDGPRCLGRAVLGGLGRLHDAPVVMRGPEGAIPVSFSYGQIEVGTSDALLTITIRPRRDTPA
ncbi:MAG TPA: winged helix-turn-helix domain-containing protein [Candidatus Limnocylindria bacterium]|nr:winged helix-turn-helix domain-containing protein [Candidatus Limnocylindria bacterium]